MWIYFVMHFLLHASRKNNSNNNLSALLLTTSLLIHDNGGLSLLPFSDTDFTTSLQGASCLLYSSEAHG